jgi:hypothetical protein
MPKRNRMIRWLIIVEGDVEPRLERPFKNDRARVAAAQKHRESVPEADDGLYRLDVECLRLSKRAAL